MVVLLGLLSTPIKRTVAYALDPTRARGGLRQSPHSPVGKVLDFMPQDAHVVCYVAESHRYLDYNRRKQAAPLVSCDRDLAAMSTWVAESFRSPWRPVSEFTCRNRVRRFVSTVFH